MNEITRPALWKFHSGVMNRQPAGRTIAALAILVALLVAACSRPPSVVVGLAAPTAFITESLQANATLSGVQGSQDVTWSSSDESVAVVSTSGLVTAVDVGTAEITATSVANPTLSDSAELTVVSPLTGTTIVYFVDSVLGTDVAALALQHAVDVQGATVVVADGASFVTDLAAEPDLVVYNQQNTSDLSAGHVDALTAWVADGGALAFTHWDEVSADGLSVWAVLEATPDLTWNYGSVSVTQSALGLGLSSQTVPLTNPGTGWGTYNIGLEPTGEGEAWALYGGSDSAAVVVGNSGRTASVGFLNDTVPEEDGARLYLNLFYSLMLAD